VSTDEGKDWAEVCKVFKDLVGTHLVSEEQRMRAQLTGGQVTQGRDTVAVYRLRLPEVPESMLCLYFGNGLKGSLKTACARTPEGKVWESLDDLMQYAIGQEGRETASGASSAIAGTGPAVHDRTDLGGMALPSGRRETSEED
jgi:hypothetical protein